MQPLKTRGSMRVNMMLTSVLTRLSHARSYVFEVCRSFPVNKRVNTSVARSFARLEVCRSFRVNKRVNMKVCHLVREYRRVVVSCY